MSPDSLYYAIMCGGRGTRLWPLSRPEKPKQFIQIFGGKSLLQLTWERARNLVDADRIVIIGDAEHEDLLRSQLPDLLEINLLLEPEGRNTAACIMLGALHVSLQDRDAVMLVSPADHLIENEDEYCTALSAAAVVARDDDRLVCIGIEPESQETRFGYMQTAVLRRKIGHHQIYDVARFVEKPDKDVLAEMFEAGALRNTGTFGWKVSSILGEIGAHQPSITESFAGYSGVIGTDEENAQLQKSYSQMPAISIDHGVISKSAKVSVVKSGIRRIDVGDFSAFAQLWENDESFNAHLGVYTQVDSSGNIVFTDGPRVSTVGMKDTIIIVDGDEVLVCPRDKTQDIKKLRNKMEE